MTKQINSKELAKAVGQLLGAPQNFCSPEAYATFMNAIGQAVCDMVDSPMIGAEVNAQGEWHIGVWGVTKPDKGFADSCGGFWFPFDGMGQYYTNSHQTMEELMHYEHPMWTVDEWQRAQKVEGAEQLFYIDWLATKTGIHLGHIHENITPYRDFFSDAINATSISIGSATCTVVRPDLVGQEVLGVVTEAAIIHPDLCKVRPDIAKALSSLNPKFSLDEWTGRPVAALAESFATAFDPSSTPVITVGPAQDGNGSTASSFLAMGALWQTKLTSPNTYLLPSGDEIVLRFDMHTDAQQLMAA